MSYSTPTKIQVKFVHEAIENMINLLKAAPLSSKAPIDATDPWKLGITHDYLGSLKKAFELEWSWDKLEKEIAKYENFTVHYSNDGGDELDLHYVHVKSKRSDAIPLMLLHGWPGVFFTFFAGMFYHLRTM